MAVSQRGGSYVTTHELITWTVILGELVVNCLVEIGTKPVVGVPRRARKAGRSSLEFIEAGGGEC